MPEDIAGIEWLYSILGVRSREHKYRRQYRVKEVYGGLLLFFPQVRYLDGPDTEWHSIPSFYSRTIEGAWDVIRLNKSIDEHLNSNGYNEGTRYHYDPDRVEGDFEVISK